MDCHVSFFIHSKWYDAGRQNENNTPTSVQHNHDSVFDGDSWQFMMFWCCYTFLFFFPPWQHSFAVLSDGLRGPLEFSGSPHWDSIAFRFSFFKSFDALADINPANKEYSRVKCANKPLTYFSPIFCSSFPSCVCVCGHVCVWQCKQRQRAFRSAPLI